MKEWLRDNETDMKRLQKTSTEPSGRLDVVAVLGRLLEALHEGGGVLAREVRVLAGSLDIAAAWEIESETLH